MAENVFFGRQPVGRWGAIDRARLQEGTREVLAELDVELDPETVVEDLSPAEQQMVEIAKAISIQAQLLVLDEPTSTLTEAEITILFRVINRLRERGAGIIYISHRMAEVFRICDRITVLRDGEYQGTFVRGEVTEEQPISRMVGREFRFRPAEGTKMSSSTRPALEVRGLSDDRLLRQISIQAHAGEITALAGLAGSGRTELAMAVLGARPITTGQVLVQGRAVFADVGQRYNGVAQAALELTAAYAGIGRALGRLSEKTMDGSAEVRLLAETKEKEAAAIKKIAALANSLRSDMQEEAQRSGNGL